jgi:hypothetical protein
MKHLTVLFLSLVLAVSAQGQTFQEWFNQKSTQRKYLLEQIAALKVYSGYLKKGYSIAKDGTNLISDIRHGDFGIHNSYFNDLGIVNPAIKDDPKIKDIIAMQSAMVRLRQKITADAVQGGQLSAKELKLLEEMLAGLATTASKELDELRLIVENGKVKMSDDERLRRIDLLYDKMQAGYSFQKRLHKNVLAITAARKQQKADLHNLKSLYGTGN